VPYSAVTYTTAESSCSLIVYNEDETNDLFLVEALNRYSRRREIRINTFFRVAVLSVSLSRISEVKPVSFTLIVGGTSRGVQLGRQQGCHLKEPLEVP
jgi:hypothetical protein